MNRKVGSGIGMLVLALCTVAVPRAAANAASATDVPVEPVCKKEIRTGSRIPVRVCQENSTAVQTLQMSEQIIRPADLGYVLSAGFPGLSVQTGTGSGGNVRQ